MHIQKLMAQSGNALGEGKTNVQSWSQAWRAWAAVWTLTLALILAGKPALAQPTDSTPPVFSATDERGVDLLSGRLLFPTPSVSVGQLGQGGLSYAGFYQPWNYRDTLTGTVKASGSARIVSIGSSSESFVASGSNWISNQAVGSTLTYNSGAQEWTYTLRDGTVAKFSRSLGQLATAYGAVEGLITSMTAPNGEVTTFHYNTIDVLYCPYPGGGCVGGIGPGDPGDPNGGGSGPSYELLERMVRLQSVTNNLGYQIHLTYRLNPFVQPLYNTTDNSGWRRLSKVTAINNAVEYCNPLASTCTLSQPWPTLNFANQPSFWQQVTDSLGRTTQSSYAGGVFTYKPPGVSSPVISAQINATTFRATSVTVGASTWNYTYVDASGQRTTTVTAPGGSTRVLVSSLTTGLPVSATNELGQTTSMTHDGNGRLTQITYPEGNQLRYVYDSRGNITELRRVAKSGSGLTDLVETASYPGTCTNAKTCNRPIWTRDTSGQQTDYTYDSTHGGLLTATAPAASAGGTRPQSRYSFSQLFAWYLQGGAVAQAPSAVWRLTESSSCSTGTAPGCVGTASETRTTIGYGSTGVGNNRLPVTTSIASGNGAVSTSSSQTFTITSDISTVDGPLSGSADTSYYFYDAMRNPLGVVGADPDGAGALLRRAAKLSYNSSGLVSAMEQGTATSTTLAALNALTVLERAESDYDAQLRPVARRLKSGSTILALRQVSYDNRGRIDCDALRLNPATFASPPASACSLATTGANGPDRISRYTYDAASRVTEITGAYGTSEAGPDIRTTYTNNGRQASIRDQAGKRTEYTYDGFDRLLKTNYPDAVTVGVASSSDYEQYTYDASGRLSQHRIRSGQSTSFTYDLLGRLTSRTPPSGQPAFSYTYDLFGRTLTTSQTGHSLAFAYDALGRQVSETSPQGTMSWLYDAAGRRIRATWPDAFYVTYDYDVTGAATHVRENGATSGAGVLATYSYDNLGRLSQIARGNGVTSSMSYDASSQLQSFAHNLTGTAQDQTLAFTYNVAGQILTRSMSNDLYALTGLSNIDHTFTVDGLNRYLTGAGVMFSHDTRGNLTQDGTRTYGYDFDNRLTSVTGVGGAVSLSYDPAGRLYQTAQTGGATARFLYDGANLAAEYDGSNVLTKRYVHGPGLDNPLTAYTGSGTSSRRWLIADERGSVIAETDATGAAVQINAYDAFGIPAAGNSGRFGFTGQMWIAEIGSYSYRNRVYHPRLGRFLQTDPIRLAGGLNLYAYVGNDPVNWIDPWGLETRLPTVRVTGIRLPDPYDLQRLIDNLGRRATRNIGDLVIGLLPRAKQAVEEEATEFACRTPPIGAAYGVDAYAGPGATLQSGLSIDPKTGQLSLFGSVGVGVGVSLQGNVIPGPLPYASGIINAPSGLSGNITGNISGTSPIGIGAGGSMVLAGSGETGSISSQFFKAAPGAAVVANGAGEVSVPLTPYLYDIGCNEDN